MYIYSLQSVITLRCLLASLFYAFFFSNHLLEFCCDPRKSSEFNECNTHRNLEVGTCKLWLQLLFITTIYLITETWVEECLKLTSNTVHLGLNTFIGYFLFFLVITSDSPKFSQNFWRELTSLRVFC